MLEHPDVSFVIEEDTHPGRYLKRYPNGEVEAATTTDYLLLLILTKLGIQPAEKVEPAESEDEPSKAKHTKSKPNRG